MHLAEASESGPLDIADPVLYPDLYRLVGVGGQLRGPKEDGVPCGGIVVAGALALELLYAVGDGGRASGLGESGAGTCGEEDEAGDKERDSTIASHAGVFDERTAGSCPARTYASFG